MARKRRRQVETEDELQKYKKHHTDQPLPPGIFHHDFISEVPWATQHYWRQRYDIFSRYDAGIWMTEAAWYGVTQEVIANRLASHIAASAPASKAIILDAFCGVGGNTIAFALSGHWQRVYAIEKDPATLQCARHNAQIYGVQDRITWFQGDCFEILGLKGEEGSGKSVEALRAVVGEYGVVFASPPWGGPGYKADKVFDLNRMEPYSFRDIHDKFSKLTKHVALYLPRTSDLRQIAECVEDEKKVQIVHYCTNRRSRAMCAYMGEWETVNA